MDNGDFDMFGNWCSEFEAETEHELTQLDNLLKLSKDVSYDTPLRCKITIELEPCECQSKRDGMRQRNIEIYSWNLATALGCTAEEVLDAVKNLANHCKK